MRVEAVYLAFAFVACSVLLGCNFTASPENVVSPLYMVTHAIVLLSSALALPLIALVASGRLTLILVEAAAVLLMVAAFLLAALVSDGWLSLGANIAAGSRLAFEMALWMVALKAASSGERGWATPVALLVGLRSVSEAAANLAVPALTASPALSPTLIYRLALALFFIASILFLFAQFFLGTPRKPQGVPEEAMGGVAQACRSIAETRGITPRELEIMEYVARGYSSRWIAETLCLSVSTVQTHVKSIYRKLGVHGKQDVIAMVNEAVEGRPEGQ